MKLTPVEEFHIWLKLPQDQRCGEFDPSTGLLRLQRKKQLDGGEFRELITTIYIPSILQEEKFKQLGINGYEDRRYT